MDAIQTPPEPCAERAIVAAGHQQESAADAVDATIVAFPTRTTDESAPSSSSSTRHSCAPPTWARTPVHPGRSRTASPVGAARPPDLGARATASARRISPRCPQR